YVGDGPAKPVGTTALTTAAHFRRLTPMVVAKALERAGTTVCEPMVRVSIELPAESVGSVLTHVTSLGGFVEHETSRGPLMVIGARLPAAEAQELRRRLPGLTAGEGVMETDFAGYQPVHGAPPRQGRSSVYGAVTSGRAVSPGPGPQVAGT
ncbi:MAG TPA: hypothetical protein VMF65_19555, partial [Acidimicrobiales bacterium]|nr:hypothetical protein [Acidimicrobiales bacterium]